MGVLLGSLFPVGAVACGAWLLTAVVFRYSSLAALVALTAAPVYAAWIGAYPVALAAGALTLLSIFTHRANIERLIRGQEPKIGGGGAGA
jgi:glycerol-3-phosphate acyltransferase PlsY